MKRQPHQWRVWRMHSGVSVDGDEDANLPEWLPDEEWSHLDSNQGPPACENDKGKIHTRMRMSWAVLRRWFQPLITRFRKSVKVRR